MSSFFADENIIDPKAFANISHVTPLREIGFTDPKNSFCKNNCKSDNYNDEFLHHNNSNAITIPNFLNDNILHEYSSNDISSTFEKEIEQRLCILDNSPSTLTKSTHDSSFLLSSPTEKKSADDIIQREMQESEKLARELMQQESLHAYQTQLDFMRDNSEQIDEETMRAITMALRETAEENYPIQIGAENLNLLGDEDDDNSELWTYDELLEIGEVIGDVKTERWRQKASSIIQTIPLYTYEELSKTHQERLLGSDCVVCMEAYNLEDSVLLLPCQHTFHQECMVNWIANHNSCPVCKAKVAPSP